MQKAPPRKSDQMRYLKVSYRMQSLSFPWPEAEVLARLIVDAQSARVGAVDELLAILRPSFVAFFERRLPSDLAEDLAQLSLLRSSGAITRIDPQRADSYIATVARTFFERHTGAALSTMSATVISMLRSFPCRAPRPTHVSNTRIWFVPCIAGALRVYAPDFERSPSACFRVKVPPRLPRNSGQSRYDSNTTHARARDSSRRTVGVSGSFGDDASLGVTDWYQRWPGGRKSPARRSTLLPRIGAGDFTVADERVANRPRPLGQTGGHRDSGGALWSPGAVSAYGRGMPDGVPVCSVSPRVPVGCDPGTVKTKRDIEGCER